VPVPAQHRGRRAPARSPSDSGSHSKRGDCEGLFHHIRLARKRQRGRRGALLATVDDYLPHARVQGVAAGLHLLVTFPGLVGQVSDRDLADRIYQTGVLVHPLSFHCERDEVPGLVMGYAAHRADQLRDAMRRISQVIR
jgi:GntR family transcriptional regulator/MocR family aminotransferase